MQRAKHCGELHPRLIDGKIARGLLRFVVASIKSVLMLAAAGTRVPYKIKIVNPSVCREIFVP